jgi:hypothetical protein
LGPESLDPDVLDPDGLGLDGLGEPCADGMTRRSPEKIRLPPAASSFAATIAATEVSCCAAISLTVSPGCTTYDPSANANASGATAAVATELSRAMGEAGILRG